MHCIKIHPQFTGQAARGRRCRYRRAAGTFRRCRCRHRVNVRRGFRLNYRCGFLRSNGRRCFAFRFSAREDDQNITHVDRVAGRDPHLGHRTGKRRRDRGDRLVRLHLEQGVALPDLIAGVDEDVHDLTLVNTLSQVGQLEFMHHGRSSYPSLSNLRAASTTRPAWGR
jgi:hypothetical protein